MWKFFRGLFKIIVAAAAVANIVLMMVFEYDTVPLRTFAVEHLAWVFSVREDAGGGATTAEAAATAETAATALTAAVAEEDKEPEGDELFERNKAEGRPTLELTDEHIYLKVGDHFNFMNYIKTMKDVDGSMLDHYIHLDKSVSTSRPAEYELTYRITSTITGKTDEKVLLITVED